MTKLMLITALKTQVEEAYAIIQQIDRMDLRSDFRANFNTNKQALSQLRMQLMQVNPSSGRSGGGGCYIATMAYGGYEHPQVIILRRFRDEVLANSSAGRLFVHLYYRFSPWMVNTLGNKPAINAIIRTTLDQFIKILKK